VYTKIDKMMTQAEFGAYYRQAVLCKPGLHRRDCPHHLGIKLQERHENSHRSMVECNEMHQSADQSLISKTDNTIYCELDSDDALQTLH
jgi:hypothetical protein